MGSLRSTSAELCVRSGFIWQLVSPFLISASSGQAPSGYVGCSYGIVQWRLLLKSSDNVLLVGLDHHSTAGVDAGLGGHGVVVDAGPVAVPMPEPVHGDLARWWFVCVSRIRREMSSGGAGRVNTLNKGEAAVSGQTPYGANNNNIDGDQVSGCLCLGRNRARQTREGLGVRRVEASGFAALFFFSTSFWPGSIFDVEVRVDGGRSNGSVGGKRPSNGIRCVGFVVAG